MKVVLALDTSTAAISVAVAVAEPGGAVLSSRMLQTGNRHVEELVPLVRDVLALAGASTADVRSIAVGVGPGPFTGTRVGVVTALTLGAALRVPVTGVCSLDVLALGAVRAGVVRAGAGEAVTGWAATEFLAVTDARRREVYWARYAVVGGAVVGGEATGGEATGGEATGGGVRRLGEPSVDHAAAVPGAGELAAVGAGAVLYGDVFTRVLRDGPRTPDAAVLAVAVTGSLLAEVPPEPLYLRRPDARPAPPPVPAAGIAR